MKALTRQQRYYLLCLAARTAAFIFLVVYALSDPQHFDMDLGSGPSLLSPLTAVWLLLMLSMAFRLLPSRVESLGCQKLFAARLRPTGIQPPSADIHSADRGALRVLVTWMGAHLLIFGAHAKGLLGTRFLVCLAGFYGVCDIVCILFFCPFQSWMMHNRCCTTCRIYDWDYLMLCTPLLPIGGMMALSACLLAGVIFLRWEGTYRRNPARFFECSNGALRCSACQEHLCQYKRALAAWAKKSPAKKDG